MCVTSAGCLLLFQRCSYYFWETSNKNFGCYSFPFVNAWLYLFCRHLISALDNPRPPFCIGRLIGTTKQIEIFMPSELQICRSLELNRTI
jgi:hypothetical protein